MGLEGNIGLLGIVNEDMSDLNDYHHGAMGTSCLIAAQLACLFTKFPILERSQWFKSVSKRDIRSADAGDVSASLFPLVVQGANPFSDGGRCGTRPLCLSEGISDLGLLVDG